MAPSVRMKRVSRAVRVGETPYGKGVFARRRFSRRETIAEIEGTLINDPLYGSCYCMELDGSHVLEPSAPLRFVNHSCQPNCELITDTGWDDDAGEKRHTMYLRAMANIEPGEQLTIDYAWPAHYAIPCLCESPNCRGWIVAPEELDRVLARQQQQ